jgi:hypothetical protein
VGLPTNAIRLLPDFIIIGAPRAGTSSLFRYLSHHPYVRPALKKEVRFFDRNFRKGVAWYRAHFPSVLHRSYFKWRYGREFITGEGSPQYLFHPFAARRAARVLPKAKLIVLLRNPVDRAYSHYHFVRIRRYEPRSFEDAVQAEFDSYEREMQRMLADESYTSAQHRPWYVARGIYVDQLREWMSHFPREQFLVLLSEELFEGPEATLERVEDFLNLPNGDPHRFQEIYDATNPGAKRRYPRMQPSTRDRLLDYFGPHNRRLSEFLGLRLPWDK